MSYKKWFDAHALKHKAIMEKLYDKNSDEVIAYFDFENMKEKEPDFCPLYAKNEKCHKLKELNCYLCGCPNFRFNDSGFKQVEDRTLFSYCNIDSVDGAQFLKHNSIHQNCSACVVPHSKEYVKKYFHREWRTIMKDVFS